MPFLSMKSAERENIRYPKKMASNYFRESKLMLSDSLNGQRWIFLKKGLDDFRDGFPPSSDNMVVCGPKRTVPILFKNNVLKSSCTAKQKERKKGKIQVCLSKLSPLQQTRREYVVQLFQEVLGVLYPEVCLSGKVGYHGYEQKSHMLQDLWEDKTTQAKSPQTKQLSQESQSNNTCIWLSKKKVSGGEKVAELNSFAVLDEHIKRMAKHFCDWVTTLGGGNCNIDEGALMRVFSTSCGNKAAFPSPFHVVQLGDMQAEQFKGQETLPGAAVRSSHTKDQPWSFKEMEIPWLHSAHLFKEFLEGKGYRKPQFLLKMLSEEDGGHEEAPKSCRFPNRCGRNRPSHSVTNKKKISIFK